MTTQLETAKAEYLAEFKRSVPRLKELAKAIRAEDVKLTNDSENTKFWQFTDDPKTNYELCQLATDLEGYDEFWASHPDNKEETSPAPNTQEGDRITLEQAIVLTDSLPKAEKLRLYEYLLTDVLGSKYNLPFEVIDSIFRYTQKFKECFPKLKELAIKAYDHPLMITDEQIDSAADLMAELADDLASECRQFAHDVTL